MREKPKQPPSSSKFRAETRILESLPWREALLFEPIADWWRDEHPRPSHARVGTAAPGRAKLGSCLSSQQLQTRYSFASKRK